MTLYNPNGLYSNKNQSLIQYLRLENFFDLQDKFRSIPNSKTNISQMKYESINLGAELNPQTINLGIDCTPAEKTTFIKLFKEFKDVFAWTYDDLKTFNTQVMQHIIPIKQESKPFQQKLRK